MKRRILVTALAVFCASLVIVKCRAMGDMRHGYLWEPDPDAPACEAVVWHQVSRSRIPGLCMDLRGRAASERTSCALGCLVISPYSEYEAKHIDLWGESLFDHEARHVLKRMRHPQ